MCVRDVSVDANPHERKLIQLSEIEKEGREEGERKRENTRM